MSNWHGLVYPIREDSQDAVEAAFQTTDHPRLEVSDESGNVVGRLLGTLAFIGAEVAVRIIEIEGSPRAMSTHMSRQPQARIFQSQLQPHLSVNRNTASIDSMRAFFMNATLHPVTDRRPDRTGFQPKANWHSWYYPLKPGSEDQVKELFQEDTGTDLSPGTVRFVGNRKAVILAESESPVPDVSARLAGRPECRELHRRLQPYIATDPDLATEEALRTFLRSASLRCVLSRHNGGLPAASPM